MLIAEISQLTGTPPATIKYYVREGLLPQGTRLAGNRTEYGEEHVRRLRLIRALLEVGQLSISTAAEVIAVLDQADAPIGHAFSIAQDALARSSVSGAALPSEAALARIDALASRAGWRNCGDNVGRGVAARVLDAYTGAEFALSDDYLDHYASAATLAAEADLSAVAEQDGRSRMIELMVIGTVLSDTLAIGLRRMAQAEMTSARGLI